MNTQSTSPNSFPLALPVGTVLRNGDFTIEGVLGQGGFGITYRATDGGLHRTAAIKEFFPEGSQRMGKNVLSSGHSDGDFQNARTRFLQEARTLAQFNHPHIVNVYTIFEENNTAYMVMEFLGGDALSGLVESRGAMAPNLAIPIIEQVGAALEVVHRAGMLHLDVKPDNVIVEGSTPALRAVLLDFGLTRKLETATGYGTTRLDAFARFGTAGYAPPEQYSRMAQTGVYTDVYALAATLYFLLTGQIPPDSVDRASGAALPDPRSFNREVSPALAAALTSGLALDPQSRPQNVRAFLDLLDAPAVAQQSTPVAPRSTPVAPPATRRAPVDEEDENDLARRQNRPRDDDDDAPETMEEIFDQLFGGQDPFSKPAPRRRPNPFQIPQPMRRAPQQPQQGPFGQPTLRVSPGCGCGPSCISFIIFIFFVFTFLGALFNS